MKGPRAARLVPLAIVLALLACVAIATDRSPTRLTPALAFAPPSGDRPLGSGEAGLDLLPMVVHASLRAIGLASVVAAIGCAIGLPLGAFSALVGRPLEAIVARACDLLQAFPTFLLAIAVLSSARHPTRLHIGVVFALTAWAPFARLAIAEGRVLRSAAFVEAAFALGRTRLAVLARHVIPNLLGVMAVQLGSSAAAIVVSEAALAFVGFGPEDGVSLGAVLDQGVAAMIRAPHVLAVGSISVFVVSASLLAAGRALEPERRIR